MLETLLGSILGNTKKDGAEPAEGGIQSLLPLIVLGCIVLGGLKLLARKEEEE